MNDFKLRLKETKFSVPKKIRIQLEKIEKDIKKQEKELEKIELAPTYSKKYLLKRANYLYYVGNYAGACEIFDKILEIDPENINAICGKGLIFRIENNLDESLRCFDRMLEIDPENTNAKTYKDKISNVMVSVTSNIPATLPLDVHVCQSCGYVFSYVPIPDESFCICGIRYVSIDLQNSNKKGVRR